MTIAEMLWDHFDVTLIDMKEFFEYNPASVRCSVDDDWINNIIIPYSDIAKSHPGKFTFLQGKLTKVNNDDTIEITHHDGRAETVNYNYLVLATGFFYEQPIKDEKSVFIADRVRGIKEFTKKVTEAKSILLAGAGIVGLEIMGELVHKYPNGEKKLGICLRGNRLGQ